MKVTVLPHENCTFVCLVLNVPGCFSFPRSSRFFLASMLMGARVHHAVVLRSRAHMVLLKQKRSCRRVRSKTSNPARPPQPVVASIFAVLERALACAITVPAKAASLRRVTLIWLSSLVSQQWCIVGKSPAERQKGLLFPQHNSQLCFYGSLSHQRITHTLSLLTGVSTQSESSQQNYCCNLHSNHAIFLWYLPEMKASAPVFTSQERLAVMWSPPEHRSSSSSQFEGRTKASVQLNQQICHFQLWTDSSLLSVSFLLLLLLLLFFCLSPTDTLMQAHKTPNTEIYLHYRCFYFSPSNFSLNSASMYNAFEGYWIGFFSLLLPLFLVLYSAA